MSSRIITIGTRGSRLAIAQAQEVISALRVAFPATDFQVKTIRTSGDRARELPPQGEVVKGLFVKEIEEELARGGIDIAVHSMKDLPTEQPQGLVIAAVTRRADPFDALISRDGEELLDLESGARVGTSSPRRAAMILNARPDLRIVPMRGNIDTRLRKLEEGLCEATVLAAAGLERLGMKGFKTQRLTPPAFLPAPGQGCIALEVRADDMAAHRIAFRIAHFPSLWAVEAERTFLMALGGGCRVPIGAFAKYNWGDRKMRLLGCVISPYGKQAVRGEMLGTVYKRKEIAVRLAKRLRRQGADKLLEAQAPPQQKA
jgi:hydroxymethylbilane synthase